MSNFWKKFKAGLIWFFYSFIWLGLLLLILDFVTKRIILANVGLGEWIPLIPGDGSFLAITYVQNNGMAFGINFNDNTINAIFFISVSLIGMGILLFVLIKYWKRLNKLTKACLMLMLAGCLGNLIDRAFYVRADGAHFVVDWIAFFGPNGFPRFNLADSSLVVGAIILIVYLIVVEVKDGMKKAKLERKEEIDSYNAKIAKDSQTIEEVKPSLEKEEPTKTDSDKTL